MVGVLLLVWDWRNRTHCVHLLTARRWPVRGVTQWTAGSGSLVVPLRWRFIPSLDAAARRNLPFLLDASVVRSLLHATARCALMSCSLDCVVDCVPSSGRRFVPVASERLRAHSPSERATARRSVLDLLLKRWPAASPTSGRESLRDAKAVGSAGTVCYRQWWLNPEDQFRRHSVS